MNELNCFGLVRTEKLICGAIKTSSHFLNMTKKLNDSFKKDLESLSLNDEEKEPNWTDKIIKLFTVPERKALIDQSDDEDLVDYNTSVRRLYGFSFIFAFLLALIATTFSIILQMTSLLVGAPRNRLEHDFTDFNNDILFENYSKCRI